MTPAKHRGVTTREGRPRVQVPHDRAQWSRVKTRAVGGQMEEKKIYLSSSLIDLIGCLVTSFGMTFCNNYEKR